MDPQKNLKMSKKYFDQFFFRLGCEVLHRKKIKKWKMEKKILDEASFELTPPCMQGWRLRPLGHQIDISVPCEIKAYKTGNFLDPHNSKARQIQGYWPWAAWSKAFIDLYMSAQLHSIT